MATVASRSPDVSKNPLLRYALALLAIAIALQIGYALNPLLGTAVPYVILLPAVAFSAWYCGIWPSIASVVIGLVAARYRFIPPLHRFSLPSTAAWVGMVAFVFASAFIVAMGEFRRRENDRLQRSQEALEERIQERTAELNTANQSLRELTGRLLQLQDEERRRFARELHDSVGQVLAALSINLTTARGEIERLTKTANLLGESETLVQDMSKEVRTISYLLHPPLLDESGLSSALRWYTNGFAERSNIKVDLECPDGLGRFSREIETAVFRVVQECLTNIHRHSGSPSAMVRIANRNGVVLLEIQDQGKGIPQDKLIEMDSLGLPGVGIRGMRERIRQLGGNLDISSSSHGTTIRARLPFAGGACSAVA
jgi:signal transduction histidine kinase